MRDAGILKKFFKVPPSLQSPVSGFPFPLKLQSAGEDGILSERFKTALCEDSVGREAGTLKPL